MLGRLGGWLVVSFFGVHGLLLQRLINGIEHNAESLHPFLIRNVVTIQRVSNNGFLTTENTKITKSRVMRMQNAGYLDKAKKTNSSCPLCSSW